LKQQQYSKMATSNALSTASILCSPKQVLFYTFPLYFSFLGSFLFWQKIANFLMGFFLICWWVHFGVTVFVGRVEEERESATQLKAEFWAINQKIRGASKCKGYCFWSGLTGCSPIRHW
jgi:hypothetical protein